MDKQKTRKELIVAFRKTNKPNSMEEAQKLADTVQQASVLPIITEEQAACLLQVSIPQMIRLRIKHNLPHFRVGTRLIRYDRVKLMETLQNLNMQ